jgi:7-cyano-7-deazaguanine reductase
MSQIDEKSVLGKSTVYDSTYDSEKLFPISRQAKRDEIDVPKPLPFYGFDFWNHYEVSWLNESGKPIVALAEISYSCESPNIIESKSMKLYFNTLNNTHFKDVQTVQAMIKKDLSAAVKAPVDVRLRLVKGESLEKFFTRFDGICLDDLDVTCSIYTPDASLLKLEKESVSEIVYSDLLKSNCLVTKQPDWASVQITYSGQQINHASLLQYLVSYRNHNEFHEQCIERIFMDIMRECQPEQLTVYGRYTRRGGLDINPYRSTIKSDRLINPRLCRQ